MSATHKQINYAKAIAEWYGVELPKDNTKQAYSEFLSKYAPRYKKDMADEMAYYGAYLESIDGGRDW